MNESRKTNTNDKSDVISNIVILLSAPIVLLFIVILPIWFLAILVVFFMGLITMFALIELKDIDRTTSGQEEEEQSVSVEDRIVDKDFSTIFKADEQNDV